jgi:AraC-like DNA-binding protein
MLDKAFDHLENFAENGVLQKSVVSSGMGVFQFVNDSADDQKISFDHTPQMLHFFFSLGGNVKLLSTQNNEEAILTGENFYLFSNPRSESVIEITLDQNSAMLSVVIGMKELHEIFGSSFGRDAAAAKEFMDNYKMDRYFLDKAMTPSIAVIVHQLFNGIHRESVRKIYQQGKIMEFLSLYMDTPNNEEETDAVCPFVIDAEEMEKIKEARRIIIERMIDPPSLKMLSKMVGTNEFKLKVGFKSVFSNTVYGYLAEYRMEQARKLLTVNNSRIKEVAAQVGYSNPSHFIAAYKKRYGITPKQHVKSLVS